MKRKELKARYGEVSNSSGEPEYMWVYPQDKADAVMDKYEERIKGLCDDLHEIATDLGIANERVKELEVEQTKKESKENKCMERKDLKKYDVCAEYYTDIDGCRIEEYEDEDGSYYQVEEADAVMNSYEGEVKHLEHIIDAQDERIMELEASQQNWISFGDKVPKMYQNILVNVPGANEENRMEPTRSIFWCPAREEELKHEMLYYTHWMPAPQPPKEAK